jgi:hypothetical protein
LSVKPEKEKIWGPFIDGLGMELTVKVHYRGLWEIETRELGKPIYGKATMVIQIRNPKTNEVVDYSPKHSEICDAILDAMLQAEVDNDTFIFKEGAYGPNSSRPTEVFKKINQAKTKLLEWTEKAAKAGLTPPAGTMKETSIVDEDDWLPEYWPFDNKEQYLKWLRE